MTIRVVCQWSQLPQRVIYTPSLQVSRHRLAGDLSDVLAMDFLFKEESRT